jgi:hypothetical protein
MAAGTHYLVFDGERNYVEIADSPDLSVATTGQLSVSAWIRPDVLTFPVSESTGYVHWMGKGEPGQREWVFRMYNETTTDPSPRPNRISFYVFNLSGKEGIGSYVQEPLRAQEWMHIVGIADGETTSIYKNGEFKRCDRYWPGPLPQLSVQRVGYPNARVFANADRHLGFRQLLPWGHTRSKSLEPRVDGGGGWRALWRLCASGRFGSRIPFHSRYCFG